MPGKVELKPHFDAPYVQRNSKTKLPTTQIRQESMEVKPRSLNSDTMFCGQDATQNHLALEGKGANMY